ncbi:hypothetical protein CFE70_009569 [Pyrenophora teres f. teres 0-1]|uniref:Uncharacterized protein n=1 Tax=Pyrenophora teres f. teres (strain 0-1) TaxID=861557 RepID=E3RDW8_PYRTT|nr:hypothetical protein PTT_03256 [Pyrenophora teres f. teres 0-1]KAE8825082.1 hypothetical protein HRS9122_10181 [Pyrenophora teres f. teres]KAE8827153.1 hypothetical protein PTNB85_08506 [Pyrenophora teres f. teres]KAE8857659.1 hypothetical protein PTNB73_08907 [Pyrenophora teres f. teres]
MAQTLSDDQLVKEGLAHTSQQRSKKGKGKRKADSEDEYNVDNQSDRGSASRTSDVADDTLTVQPSKRRNFSATHATRESTVAENEEENSDTSDEEPQNDASHRAQVEDESSRATAGPDTQSTLWDGMKDEIKACWNLPKEFDIKGLIPNHMKEKDIHMTPILNRELEKYWRPGSKQRSPKKGELVRELLELARASRNRREEAQQKMEENFLNRGGRTVGKSDVRYALKHFRNESQEGDDMAGPSGSNSRPQSRPESPVQAPTPEISQSNNAQTSTSDQRLVPHTQFPPRTPSPTIPKTNPNPNPSVSASQTSVQTPIPFNLPTTPASPLLTTIQDFKLRRASHDVTIAESRVAIAQSERTSRSWMRHGSFSSSVVVPFAQRTDSDAHVDAAKLAVDLARQERDSLQEEAWRERQRREELGEGRDGGGRQDDDGTVE